MTRAYAPGRVNLIGEHTDYTGGYVLPMAVDLGVTCTATLRPDDLVAAESTARPGDRVLANMPSVQPGHVNGWAAYVIGTAWALRESGIDLPGVDLSIDSTLPAGAGLSSSAAVECAVALALLALVGQSMDPREVARIAKKAENEFVGAPTGSMDQVASMLAQKDALLFFDTGADTTRTVPFPLHQHGVRLLVIDTQVHHHLVTDEYGERRRALESASRLLNVTSLREITNPSAVELIEDDVLRRRARHVVTENARVLQTLALLEAGNVSDVGLILSAGHISLRDDLEVSCDELDIAVDAAIAGGALGARMVGGGFGGSAIALVEAAKVDNVQSSVSSAYAQRNWKLPAFYDVAPAQGARVLS